MHPLRSVVVNNIYIFENKKIKIIKLKKKRKIYFLRIINKT